MAGGTGATGCHFAGKACTRSLDACALPLCQFIERLSTPPLSPVHPSPVHRCVLLTNPSGGRALLSAGYPLGGYQTQSQSVRSRVCSFASFPCSKTKLAYLLARRVTFVILQRALRRIRFVLSFPVGTVRLSMWVVKRRTISLDSDLLNLLLRNEVIIRDGVRRVKGEMNYWKIF